MKENGKKRPCCHSAKPPWVEGEIETKGGEIPRVTTRLEFSDRLGHWKARLGVGRNSYRIEPGLYGTGRPAGDSPVLVSANYKMSFDLLRSELEGRDAWILVLDTKGINVWCAAGKGTFGTDELVSRIEKSSLAKIVTGRELILPQLGAPGVSAQEVKKRSGFNVLYGPIRASDLPGFLDSGKVAPAATRRIGFPLRSRAVLIPVEFTGSLKYGLLAAASLFLLSGIGRDGYSLSRLKSEGPLTFLLLAAAYLAGVALVPLILPLLPSRSFAGKGTWLGLILAFLTCLFWWNDPAPLGGPLGLAAWVLLIPVITSFLAMLFTGSSTYTSLSGVKREMRIAVPAQIIAALAGVGLWLAGRFF